MSTGRYQSPYPVDYDELERFLYTYRKYLEEDGRHHIWISSVGAEGQLIFDNHKVVYTYGPLREYERRLRARGLGLGEVKHPIPHSHNYHAAFDAAEDMLMNHWEWIPFQMDPSDDP